ncbi:hypothetical protein EK21DRAFT_118413 [Setomelanomma holmii]|uniref:Uncharacterized protein n=1 Tax=Setomelanomma holmii TaxID=210430 RepID=A0A9P4GXJ3_9PLEO|nr:hypothetical protein EK21DRAFT_118413 [Setomelanomma holmii]
MTTFTLLPSEIRYGILERVVRSATAPAEPPDVDHAVSEDWTTYKLFNGPAYIRAEAPALLQRPKRATSQLLSLLLVSKGFHQDVQHIWTQHVAPTLFPVLSMSLVGADGDRAWKGVLLSWLSPLPVFPNVTRIEWNIRFYDQKSRPTGHASRNRSYTEDEITHDLTLVHVFEKAILRDWYGLQTHFPPELPESDDGSLGYWVLKLSTKVDPDAHLASSEFFETPDQHIKIMPHPYKDTPELKDYLSGYVEFGILTGAEVWIDDTLVCRLTPQAKARSKDLDTRTPSHTSEGVEKFDVMCEEVSFARIYAYIDCRDIADYSKLFKHGVIFGFKSSIAKVNVSLWGKHFEYHAAKLGILDNNLKRCSHANIYIVSCSIFTYKQELCLQHKYWTGCGHTMRDIVDVSCRSVVLSDENVRGTKRSRALLSWVGIVASAVHGT